MFVITALIFLVINFSSYKLFSSLKKYNYFTSHSIHKGHVSRMGGFLIYINFFIFCFLFKLDNIFIIFGSFLPAAIVTFREDFVGDISIKVRLLALIVSVILLIQNTFSISYLNMPIFYDLNTNIYFLFFITLLSYLTLINFLNFIDGLNGLCLLTSFFICLSLFLNVGYENLNYQERYLIIGLIYVILFTLPWNFPFQRFFIGDLGSYFLGFILSYLIIRFMNTNENLPSFAAVLLIIYPLFEGVFSILRRLYSKKNIYGADNFHLHSLIFKNLSRKYNIKLANNLSTLTLLPFIMYGPLFFLFFSNNLLYIYLSILIFIIIYLITYYLLHAKVKDSKAII